ncbi:MAG TPA: hypothetical protein VJT74_00415, partial [Pyrinomonadaceae bacterium]|nr:hypothetical protein [Pyrinomonadaceae bacterium]
MKNRTQFTPFIIAALCLLCSAATSSRAATPTATPKPTPLNEIKIGHCNDPKRTLESIIEAERARGLVMDARPFAINQATGKMTFDGSTGRVSVVNTNPFVYKYKITVAQEELVSTALTDFLKLLLPESLRSNVGLQSGRVNPTASRVTPITKLGLIAERLRAFDPAKCRDNAACEAVSEMKNVFELIEQQGLILNSRANDLDTEALLFTTPALSIDEEFAKYTEQLSLLRDEEADAYTVCDNATKLNDDLRKLEPQLKQFLEDVSTARKEIKKIDVLASDLEGLVAAFNRDEDLKTAGKAIRCKGFNCVEQFQEYAQTVLALIGTAGYSGELSRLETNAQEMLNMFQLTEQMKEKEGLFARTFTVIKKFELSQASIALNRTRLQTSGGSSTATSTGPQSGNAGTGGGGGGGRGSGSPEPSVVGGESSEGSAGSSSGGNNFAASGDGDGAESGDDDKDSSAKDSEGGSTAAPAGQIREVVQIGRPRFMLSGGLVYSPLPRRTFKKVTGFALDAQGQPTGDG